MLNSGLWPHQARALVQIDAAFADGKRAVLLVMPTGAGKSRTCAEWIARSGLRSLWLCHREELANQANAALTFAGASQFSVRSVQQLHISGDTPEADIVFADEGHHGASPSWSGVLARYPNAKILSATATPFRGDGTGLDGVFDHLVVPTSIRELTELGVLVPCETVAPPDVMPTGKICMSPLDAYKKYAGGRKTIVFAANLRAVQEYVKDFKKAGIRADFVDGSSENRSDVIAAYKNGLIDVLINCSVLTEGYDDPSIEVGIVARRVGSAGLLRQMVGRWIRAAPGKKSALFIDLAGISWLHGPYDEELEYSLSGGAKRKADPAFARMCPVCGIVVATDYVLCPDCGLARPEMQMPVVQHRAMQRYAKFERDTDDKRAAYMAKLLVKARVNGYKPYWVSVQYKFLYKSDPSDNIRRLAYEMAKTR